MENWKAIEGFENYLISDHGRIKSSRKILKQNISKGGYYQITLNKKNLLVHRIVAKTFISNPENKPEVNHKDTNKLNNFSSNLEWVTTFENHHHAFDKGLITYPKGEKHGRSKLTLNEVNNIRNEYIPRKVTMKFLSKKYGISYQTVFEIIKHQIWR